MKNSIIFLLGIFLLVSFSNSATNTSTVQQTNIVSGSLNLKSQADSITSVTYKMLYDNQVKSNDAVLKTIFYALGGLGTAMIFVFASNWWFNEKKVAEIIKGINSQISSEINNLRNDLQKEITTNLTNLTLLHNEFKDKINSEIKEDNKKLLDNYQLQLNSFSENINIQISTLKTSIDERITSLQKSVDINDQKSKESIENVKNRIEISSKKLKIETLGPQADLWLIKNVPINAFRCYVEEGKCSIEINSIWNLKYVLRNIEEVLNKISTVRQSDVEAFNKFINLIPDGSFLVEKMNVIELFNQKPVKEIR